MTENIQAEIGARVREAMRVKGMSQARLGELLGGLPQSSVARRLTGDIPFSAAELVVAARYLELKPADLMPVAS